MYCSRFCVGCYCWGRAQKHELAQFLTKQKSFYKELLETPFDFSKDENINLDYKNQSYYISQVQLKKYWRSRLKLSTLDRFTTKKEEEND